MLPLLLPGLVSLHAVVVEAKTCAIPRQKVVQAFNVHRNASSSTTPLQVGNGNFAFGADITGLQTFSPFGILSTWGWHNFSLPTTSNQTTPSDFTGLDWWTHGRLVNYAQPNPAESDISNWLIQNPQRLNLARIGLDFNGVTVNESQLQQKSQTLDLWSGRILSSFVYEGSTVEVETWGHSDLDVVGISVKSPLLSAGKLSVFFDFPYSDVNKFDAPYVGIWNAVANHTTTASSSAGGSSATIKHVLDDSSYVTSVRWDGPGQFSGPAPGTHRYVLSVHGSAELKLAVGFSPSGDLKVPVFAVVVASSTKNWPDYWNSGAFVDLTGIDNPNATELQRRTILTQYIMAVNSASDNPPQESGLVNNGWYGKFHLEMCLWHLIHFARWNHFPLLWRSMPGMYQRFLESSYERARQQGYAGARWGKMTDPSGRSAPGEINSLLIWQQPHPMYFAETTYRSFPNGTTLRLWDEVLTATADFMASFAYHNASTGRYDLGSPLYPVSETGNPNATRNPTFELAYWRFGLDVAARWKQRQGLAVPPRWTAVRDGLAPLPVADDAYAVYEGIPGMWTDPATTYDHPAMAGIYGWLPPPPRASGPPLNLDYVRNTADKIRRLWALGDSYGWDFSLLAMNALRLGDVDQALAYLLDPVFQFDDAGYPLGGSRVATPYLPNGASLLLTVAMMAGGWDGSPGLHFPEGWNVRAEGFVPGL